MNASLRRLAFLAAALVLLASPALHAADGSVSFSGASQYVNVPNFQNAGVSGEVTVEFWAKTNATGQQSAFMLNPDQGTNRFQAHINYFNGNTYWDCGDAGNGGRLQVGSPAGTVGNWTHYAFISSVSGGFMKIYVNGAEIASKTGASAFNTSSGSYSLCIGGFTSFFLNGSLDEFRVWNVARTQWQIQTSLGATLHGSETGLKLYYMFDEASGTTATNSATATGAAFNGTLTGGATRSTPARLTVANTNNSGAGSLRQAVLDAFAAPGSSYITFDPLLSGQTIKLDSVIQVNDPTGPVTIDASSLPGGLTLDGSGGAAAHAIFYVGLSLTNLSLHGLTLTGGKNSAIFSDGKLTLRRCTLFGNSCATKGGAIFSGENGNTMLSHCTLFGNSAANGGAIYQDEPTTPELGILLTLEHCTLSGNSASAAGGAIVSTGTYTLTVGSNTFVDPLAKLDNCIVAGNSAPSGPNLSGTFDGSNNLASGDPLLSPLGYYGGSTMTMRPLPSSPAIDAGKVIAGLSTDQRGFARNVDGNANGGAQPDIGAVELNPVIVTTTADEDNTPAGDSISLREAVRSQADVFFAPELSGQTIRLTSGAEIFLNKDVVIDASSLPAGLTVDGISLTGSNRLFGVSPTSKVYMIGLTLTGGQVGLTGFLFSEGGAILNYGTLTLWRCTLFGNTTGLGDGGAIAISNGGLLIAKQSTFCGNSAAKSGGAIRVAEGGRVELEHCTISGNSATNGNGGAVRASSSSLSIANSIIWGNQINSPFQGEDVSSASGSVALSGANFIGNFTQLGGTLTGPSPSMADPQLSQLGNYGGPTRTMVPKPGSPVINAAVGSTITSDQRGFPITLTLPDGGAAERQGKEILTVTTMADELDTPNNAQTSLREAITDGAATNIVFAPALSGGTITLESSRGEIAINQSVGLNVDATSLPKGLTINGGPGTNRVFNITSTARVTLAGLTLTGGEAPGGSGGAILTAAGTDLTLHRCTLTANTAAEGGAIFSLGRLTLELCTFNGNTGNYGGAIQCLGRTDINHCTISGNHGSSVCGGIFNKNTTEANPLTVTNSIVANNTSPHANGEDIYNQQAELVFAGVCIVVDYYLEASNSYTYSGASLWRGEDDAYLAPLGDYGGPAKTMPPRPGSRAVGRAVASTITYDQRGFPISGVADIGACEGTFIWLPSPDQSATISNLTPTLSWRWVGPTGATFAVYIARTSGALGGPIVSGLTNQSYTIPPSESLNAYTYYWRVDTTVNGVTYTGQEFSFTNNVVDSAGRRDEGTTIQQALATAAANPGADTIVIGLNLDGETLGLSEITVDDTSGVTIDATDLPHGAVLDGEGLNRLFTIAAGSSLTLRGLTIRGGNGTGSDTSTHGGAFFNRGTLTLERCTLTGNTAPYGGTIFNETGGTLIMTQCTLAGNGTNPVALEAGVLYNRGTVTLTHCTVAGNTAGNFGGIYNDSGHTLTLVNCIIGGNTGELGADLRNNGTLTSTGVSITATAIQGSGSVGGTGSILTANPLLAPLGSYGGPTQTVALKPGSPARDASTGSTITSDQRGFPIAGVADLGAYEAGAGELEAVVNFNLWAWEIMGQALLPEGDNDNDGINNQLEYAAKTNPFAANTQPVSPPSQNTGGGSFAAFSLAGGDSEAAAAPPPSVLSYDLSFRYNPEATDLRYILQRSSDLSPTGWTDIYTYDSTTSLITETSGVIGDEDPVGNLIYITDSAFNPARTFWRLVVEQP